MKGYRWNSVLAATLLAASTTALAQQASPSGSTAPPDAFAERCAALGRLDIQSIADAPGVIVSAQAVAPRASTEAERVMFERRGHVQGNPTPKLEQYPAHCRVEGYVAPSVKFRLLLPPDAIWNQRFMLSACDAWCGEVIEDIVVPGLHAGYATITNDGGHYGGRPFDGVWAYNNVQARIDFAYRANHVTAQVGKEITRAFYGAPARYAYIAGFSKGGNAGLFSAQKYPEDFDGIFVKAPVVKYNAKNSAHFQWLALAVQPDGRTPLLDTDKLPLLVKAANAACDAQDGLEDGIIDDPRRCNYDPGVLLCRPGQSERDNACLSESQVAAVRKIYARPVDAAGKAYFDFPVDIGSEVDWGGALLPPPDNTDPNIPFLRRGAITGLRYLVLKDSPGPDYDWTRFDYVAERAKIEEMSRIFDPDSIDLSAFHARGGKLIIVHGWADVYVSANMTIDWYERMRQRMGGDTVDRFTRLYVVPGMRHGTGGSGPYVFDTQGPLVRWVEQGIAPGDLLVEDPPGTEPSRSRPMCPYPSFPRYRGTGDRTVAASFECASR